MNEDTKATFQVFCNDIRREVKTLAAETKLLASEQVGPVLPREDRGEMIANLMLAYRHLEDASMRLGKAIQASDGGVSVYDRATTVGA